MAIGLLTDSFLPTQIDAMHPEDWRRTHPDFRTPRLARNLELRDRLRTVAEAHDTSVSAIAVAWVLSWPEVTGAIVGASNPAQVDEWLPAAGIALTDPDLAYIAEAVETTGAGTGPVRPSQASTTST
jgi:aryl-alcohol dehydrogenase-like predicted oxidoreductase